MKTFTLWLTLSICWARAAFCLASAAAFAQGIVSLSSPSWGPIFRRGSLGKVAHCFCNEHLCLLDFRSWHVDASSSWLRYPRSPFLAFPNTSKAYQAIWENCEHFAVSPNGGAKGVLCWFLLLLIPLSFSLAPSAPSWAPRFAGSAVEAR